MTALLNRRNWKVRTVRTIRQGQSGVIRYPFQARLIEVEPSSRSARSHWVKAGYLDTLARLPGISGQKVAQTTFLRLFEAQWVWIPEGITSYWLKLRLPSWLSEVKVSIKEFVGECSSDDVAALRGQLDRIEIKVDRLNP